VGRANITLKKQSAKFAFDSSLAVLMGSWVSTAAGIFGDEPQMSMKIN